MLPISFNEFMKVDIRVGRVTRVEDFPAARKPAYKLWIDFGPLGIKKSSAQLTRLHQKEDLLDRLVAAVPPRQVADFMSEVLVLGAMGEDNEVILLQPDRPVSLGMKIA
jgi:tRNA-binding protein